MASLSDLAKKYNSFQKPAFYIKIDDKDVPEKKLQYMELEITSTSGYEASVCSLRVHATDGKFDDKKNEVIISDALTKTFELGKKLDVFLGYDKKDNCKQVFSGFITSINLEYTGESYVRYIVEAMDAKFLLMNNLRSEAKKDMKKYSEVVNDVLSGYSSYLGKLTIKETSELGSPIEQYNQSDYDFIVGIAKKLNFMFYLYNSNVFFVPYAYEKEPDLSLTPGRYLLRFTREITLDNQIKSVTVRSNNEQNPEEVFEATANNITVAVGNGKSAGGDISKIIGDKMQKTIIDPSVKSTQEAQERAQAELDKVSLKFSTGEFETVGIPDIEPGKFIYFDKMNSLVKGKYFITEVKHLYDKTGYRTVCKYTNNKI